MNRKITHYELLDNHSTVVFINISIQFLKDIIQNVLSSKLTEQHAIFQFLKNNAVSDETTKSYIEFSNRNGDAEQFFRQYIDAIQLALVDSKAEAIYFQKGYLVKLLDTLQNMKQFSTHVLDLTLSKENFTIQRVKHFIEQRNGIVHRLDISNHLHYNEDYLNRVFKKNTGETLIQFAQKIKLKYIQQLLLDDQLSIHDIIQKAGFQHESHFYHFFKQQTQMSPKQYQSSQQ